MRIYDIEDAERSPRGLRGIPGMRSVKSTLRPVSAGLMLVRITRLACELNHGLLAKIVRVARKVRLSLVKFRKSRLSTAHVTAANDEIERAREEERTRVAREIHDDVGGALVALKMHLAQLRPGANETDLAELRVLVDAAASSTQRVIRALRPSILDQGLVSALACEAREFEHRTGVRCSFFSNRDDTELPAAQCTAVYRVCQEALTNVVKHARATKASVELHRGSDGVTLEVRDNGVGLDRAALDRCDAFGIVGMRERARSFGGWLEVSGAPGEGATVMLQIPLRRAHDLAMPA